MKKLFAILISLIICLSFTACEKEQAKTNGDITSQKEEMPIDAWSDSETNTFVSSNNNKLAASQGNTHYYAVDTLLYREDMTGKHETESVNIGGSESYYSSSGDVSIVRNICPVGDTVYFTYCALPKGQYITGNIYSHNFNTNTSNSDFLGKTRAVSLAYNDGYLYFRDSDLNLCRANIKTEEITVLLNDDEVFSYEIHNNKIYYDNYVVIEGQKNRSIEIHSMNLDGSEKKLLFQSQFDNYNHFCIIDNNLQFTLSKTENSAEQQFVYSLSENEFISSSKFAEFPHLALKINNSYYSENEKGICKYEQTSKGEWKEKLLYNVPKNELFNNIDEWSLIGNTLYYTDDVEQNHTYRMKLDGSTETLKNEYRKYSQEEYDNE